MATALTPEVPSPEPTTVMLDNDITSIKKNQNTILGDICWLHKNVAMQADMDRLEKKVDLLLEHFDLSLE